MTLSLFLGACRRNSESADYPVQPNPNIEQKKDSLLRKEPVDKPQVQKHLRRKLHSVDTNPEVSSRRSGDTVLKAFSNDTIHSTRQSDANRRFYLEQSLANSMRTPSSSIKTPSVHPDSQTWEQIAGVPQPKEKIPDWKIALGYLRMVATIVGLVYILFFDN